MDEDKSSAPWEVVLRYAGKGGSHWQSRLIWKPCSKALKPPTDWQHMGTDWEENI